MQNHEESHWYESPWKLGFVILLALLAGYCASKSLHPPELHAATLRVRSDSLLTDCGLVTRSDSSAKFVRFWYEHENGVRAYWPVKVPKESDVSIYIGWKYNFTIAPGNVVVEAKLITSRCPN